MQNSRNIRKFERFLFQGLPEQPEATYERDGHTSVYKRETGQSQSAVKSILTSGFSVIGTVSYDSEGKETYVDGVG